MVEVFNKNAKDSIDAVKKFDLSKYIIMYINGFMYR